MISKLMLAFLLCITLVQAQEPDRDNQSIVTARVTDRENAPIEGAAIYKLNWFEGPHELPAPALSDARGVFKFKIDPLAPDYSNYVLIHRDGFAFGALGLHALPARARLFPGRSIALRVSDPNGQHVKGARVMLAEVAFDDEPLHAMIPRALAAKTGAITNSDGWAKLRSIRPSAVRSLIVEADGYGEQIFPCDFKDETTFFKLQLHNTTSLKIKLMLGDEPVRGMRVVTRTDLPDVEQERAEVIQACGVGLDQVTDAMGCVVLEHVLPHHDLELYFVDGPNEFRSRANVKYKKDREQPVIVQLPKTLDEIGQEKTSQVVDSQSGKPIAGVKLKFVSSLWPDRHFEASSDESGLLNLKLLPGDWYVQVEKAAPGYCDRVASPLPMAVKDQVGEKLTNITFAKAKQLTGAIQDIDLELHRTRWIRVNWTKEDQVPGYSYGVVNPDATFSASIPENASAEDFSIGRSYEHNGKLRVKSLEPLVLSGE